MISWIISCSITVWQVWFLYPLRSPIILPKFSAFECVIVSVYLKVYLMKDFSVTHQHLVANHCNNCHLFSYQLTKWSDILVANFLSYFQISHLFCLLLYPQDTNKTITNQKTLQLFWEIYVYAAWVWFFEKIHILQHPFFSPNRSVWAVFLNRSWHFQCIKPIHIVPFRIKDIINLQDAVI